MGKQKIPEEIDFTLNDLQITVYAYVIFTIRNFRLMCNCGVKEF